MVQFFQQATLKFGFVLGLFLIAPGSADTIGREDQLVDREEQYHTEGDDENGVVFRLSQQRKGHAPTLWGWHYVGNRNNQPVDDIKPLPLPDVHYWEAAQGWTGLRNAKEAYAELEKIRPELQEHPFVRSAWLDALILDDEWAKARDTATRLTDEFPEEPGFWLHLAYATRRAEGGGMELALEVPGLGCSGAQSKVGSFTMLHLKNRPPSYFTQTTTLCGTDRHRVLAVAMGPLQLLPLCDLPADGADHRRRPINHHLVRNRVPKPSAQFSFPPCHCTYAHTDKTHTS